jgi:hypothetical protein
MFDLELAIADWRREMLAGGLKTPMPMEELESHLREDVARQMQSGVSAEHAFVTALQRLGQAGSLKSEFAKVGGNKWALFRKLKGILAGAVAPFPPLSTFTPGARQTLALARKEAPRLHHDFVATEHLLLALLTIEKGAVPNVLQKMKVDPASLTKRVEEWVISNFPSQKSYSEIPYTPRAKKALSLAAREARSSNQSCVGAEPILLGLLLEGDGMAGRVLKNVGLNSKTTREEILRELGQNPCGGQSDKKRRPCPALPRKKPAGARTHPPGADACRG